MADDTLIANLALQKLGAERITSLTQDHPNARKINNCYAALLEKELRAHTWNFSKKRAQLSPDGTAPEFDFLYAFVLPSDYLRMIKPARSGLDWTIENHNGKRAILTNEGNSINLRYVMRVTDAALFDAVFTEAFASKIAWHCCEDITQSNTKKDDAKLEYRDAMREARKINAFENIPQEEPEDSWLAARR